MVALKKTTARVTEIPDELTRNPLQAILLADSFATKFRPITLERPKVLLPLVNVPMIDYTLAWLESAGVDEVFVFCCAHSRQVIDYLEKSEWFNQPKFRVSTIESHNAVGAGDALRVIYDCNVIHGDFVLISGDTVSNMSLTLALQEHKERRKKDNKAVMTMIFKQSKPSPKVHQSLLGTDEIFVAIDPDTKRLLYYEEKSDPSKGTISLDGSLLADNPSIFLHNDMQDCYIDICSQEVLTVFTDNFDYQHLRRHFIKGLLMDDIMGYKIFSHEIHSSYAARIDNYRSYATINKDIIQRWTYPFVPDVKFSGNFAAKLEREGKYRASEIELSRSAHIGPFTVIGEGTKIGSGTKIANTVIGKDCIIGSNVFIEGSYIWDNVTIEDACVLSHSIVCDGVIMKTGAVLEPGVVLSFKVVVGHNFTIPAYSKVSLFKQPIEEDSDEELEYAENTSGTVDSCSENKLIMEMTHLSETHSCPASEVGAGGAGYTWSVCEETYEEEWRHSIAPIPDDKAEAMRVIDDDLELLNQDSCALPQSREVKPNLQSNDSDDDDDPIDFEQEVEATFLRAVHEKVEVEHVILEVNSLRLAYNMNSVDCAGALFYSMMKLALEKGTEGELYKNVASVLNMWQKLLKSYLRQIDEQIEVILKFEEMCLEFAEEFSTIFAKVLRYLYEKELIEEDAILTWADEKKDAEEADKVFMKQSENFIQWLREASEEEDDE